MRVYVRTPLSARFDKFVDKSAGADGCWLWTGCISKNGYGYVRGDHNKSESAHTSAWILSGRALEPGKEICHKCDVRNCVNPSHMFLGTRADNMADAAAKGRMFWANPERHPKGSKHPNAKLNEDAVKEILRSPGTRREEFATRFGVSPALISMVRRRTIWRHVEAA